MIRARNQNKARFNASIICITLNSNSEKSICGVKLAWLQNSSHANVGPYCEIDCLLLLWPVINTFFHLNAKRSAVVSFTLTMFSRTISIVGF